MRTDLTIDDLDGFLDEPVVAVLATIRQDGSVLLSPVWHEWRDGGFQVWSGPNDVKTRHLRREPRASIVVAESSDPLRGVEVRGTAQVLTEDGFETAVRTRRGTSVPGTERPTCARSAGTKSRSASSPANSGSGTSPTSRGG